MRYRPEIDGLRSVAVVPVILFHAGFERFSGGFVGVDVFFVISGYLITTILHTELNQGSFSLVRFYERRVRRIVPALYFVMLVSLPFAWLWLLPADMKDFSQSLVAVSLFSSNILFWHESGYWGIENELKPLLHTWSLAVEEQYYVIFPLFMAFMWRFRRRWLLASVLLFGLLSLIAAQWAAYNAPVANFFLLPTRAWELAIGAGIAFYFHYREKAALFRPFGNAFAEVMSFTGILLITYSIFSFDEAVPFPGVYALIPTLGAAFVILFSSSETVIGRVLASRAFVWVGLVSYSAYLWHQPLFAFARLRSLTEPSVGTFWLLSIATFPMAYFNWRYIEKPFRIKGLMSRKAVFSCAIAGSVLFVLIGMAGHFTSGFDSVRFSDGRSSASIKEKLRINRGLSNSCDGSFTLSADCRTSDEPEILVWGDSYAMHLMQGIAGSSPNPKVIQMTKSVCGAFFDIAPVTPAFPVNWAEGCLEFTGEVRNWIKNNKSVKYVVMSSHLNNYLYSGHQLLTRNGSFEEPSVDVVKKAFENTLQELKSMGVTPVVFSSPPANGINLGRCLAKAEVLGINLDKCNFNVSEMTVARQFEYSVLKSISKNSRVIRLDELLCSEAECNTHIGSTWIFRDKAHFSHLGSMALGKKHGFYNKIISEWNHID